MKRIGWLGAVLFVLAMSSVSIVWAQTGGGFNASFNGVSSGGTTMSGGGYQLQTSAGQSAAGRSSSGNAYSLDYGVLAGGRNAATTPGASPSPSPSVSASPSSTPSASPSPTGTPFPYKRFGPQVAKDGVN